MAAGDESKSRGGDRGAERTAPWRVQLPVYAAGLFSNSISDLASIALPLYLATIDPSPVMIGLVIGARHFLPLLLAIHGGALMDRLGARRLMVFCSALAVVVLLLFPTTGFIPLIILLQMINGLCASMGWIGAQTSFGLMLHGNQTYSGRFAFALRLGSFIGPPLTGLAWDRLGPWGAFGMMALWASGTLFSALTIAPTELDRRDPDRRLRIADLLPRLSDYRAAFRLATIPGMTIVLMVTVLRIAASGIQDSFYTIYLVSIGMSATLIGVLVTLSSALAAVSSLLVGRLTRYMPPVWLLLLTTFGSIVFVAVTPLLGSFAALAIVAAMRGVCMGISQPLMLSILVDAAGRGSQGKGVALRTTANRVAGAVTPAAMGTIASVAGLDASFLIMGALLSLATGLVAAYVWRRPELAGG
ncbi:MAG: putative arabinose efflux permease, family [Hyphomicrobiales bacterium]|nr:putative arabinose efflux permease, family [Hyphomicrobiales bacterium]